MANVSPGPDPGLSTSLAQNLDRDDRFDDKMEISPLFYRLREFCDSLIIMQGFLLYADHNWVNQIYSIGRLETKPFLFSLSNSSLVVDGIIIT